MCDSNNFQVMRTKVLLRGKGDIDRRGELNSERPFRV